MEEHVKETEKIAAVEPLSDILLVLDQKKSRIEAVEGIDEQGNLKTKEAKKSNLLDFMKVDKSDVFSNFFSNFWRRLNDPFSFRFFKTPAFNLEEVAKKLQAAIDFPTPEGNKLLESLEIKHEQQNKKVMENTEQKQSEVKQDYKFNADQIDWDTARVFGLNRELLTKTGQLEKMLKGYKSDMVFHLTANIDGAPFKGDARLNLRQVDDKVQIMMSGVRFKADLESKFYGHEFTPEDKENLLKTGNMGRAVDLVNYEDGTLSKAFISLDRFTKEPVSYPQEWVKVKKDFGGVKLNKDQKQELLEGKAVLIEGMKNSTTGELFSKSIQFSADERKFVFVEDGNGQKQGQGKGMRDDFRGRQLTDKEKKLLLQGKEVRMEDLLSRDKTKLYSGNLTFDKEKNDFNFEYDRQNVQEVKVSGKKQQQQ